MIRKYYFINKFETKNIDRLDKETAVIYRNYNSKILDKVSILKLKKYCKKNKIKLYLSNNVKLAIQFDLDGAYIPSFNKCTRHLAFSFKKKFNIIGSAHNIKEIKIKEKQLVNKIFLSSIFKKNNIEPIKISLLQLFFSDGIFLNTLNIRSKKINKINNISKTPNSSAITEIT